jgi:hypothetical protein
MVFTDGSFANNKDLSSQIGFVLTLINESSKTDNSFTIRGNVVHWSSTKCKRVTRSVLASEIYGMVSGFDIGLSIITTTWQPIWKFLLDATATNSYLLATHPPPGEPKRYPKNDHAKFPSELANGLFQHSSIPESKNPLDSLVQKNSNPSLHVMVKLSRQNSCKACAAAGRFADQRTQRKPQGDLSANTLRGTPYSERQ